jgi:hypothetical protein
MALDAAHPEARTHVECVTHGKDSFNQTHAKDEHGGHDYDDLIDLGCEKVGLPDQNSGFGPTDMDFWDFLNDSGDDNWEWLYTRLDPVGNGDLSDAGMIFYVVTGNKRSGRGTRALRRRRRAGPRRVRDAQPCRSHPPRHRERSGRRGVRSALHRPDAVVPRPDRR